MGSLPLWLKETSVVIKWTGGNYDNVNLKLIDMRGFRVYGGIAENIDNSGSYSWTIPADIPTGIYDIYIENAKNPAAYLYSGDFAIEPKDYITMAKPKLPVASQ
jgi:Ser-Thr-rich glycosyl-phosphatidyl-inositol-anchored membrane family